jgi:hypothetical protein
MVFLAVRKEFGSFDAYLWNVVGGKGSSALLIIRSRSRRKKSPLAGNAFQLVNAPVLKIDPRARDEILHRSGDQHTARLGICHDPRAGVNRDAADIVAHQFTFAGVHSRAHFNPKLPDLQCDGEGATDCSCRAVERREKTVAGGIGFLAAKARKFLSHSRVVRIQKITPCCVA